MSNIFIPYKKTVTDNKDNKSAENNDSNVNTVDMKLMLDTIPAGCVTKQNVESAKTKCEWRWLFYKINNRYVVELSYQDVNHVRLYLSGSGKWISEDQKKLDKYKQYIVKELYYYTN